MRTTDLTVTFKHPFDLASLPGPHPAGTYRVVRDETEIEGLSFLAFRSETFLYFPSLQVSSEPREVVPVRGEDLEAAIASDNARA